MPSPQENFTARLSAIAQQMETELAARLPQPTGSQAHVVEAMRYAALAGGKRLRPFLLVETSRLFETDDHAVWDAACAVECLHVYSLVHDDLPCMDDDDLRRGKPTVHKAFDEATAVLTGDALLTFSFELIAKSGASPQIKVDLMKQLATAGGIHGMIGGQVIDIYAHETDRTEALITELQALKTGALIGFSVRAGALLGGASDAQIKALSHYAQDLGLAFQIKDDILDVEGDAETVGKAVRKDETLGKATFVSILGLEAARNKAVSLGDRAKSHLDPFGQKADMLRATVDFVLNRQS